MSAVKKRAGEESEEPTDEEGFDRAGKALGYSVSVSSRHNNVGRFAQCERRAPTSSVETTSPREPATRAAERRVRSARYSERRIERVRVIDLRGHRPASERLARRCRRMSPHATDAARATSGGADPDRARHALCRRKADRRTATRAQLPSKAMPITPPSSNAPSLMAAAVPARRSGTEPITISVVIRKRGSSARPERDLCQAKQEVTREHGRQREQHRAGARRSRGSRRAHAPVRTAASRAGRAASPRASQSASGTAE